MNELNIKQKQEIVNVQQKEYKLIGKMRKIPGLTLYQLDTENNLITEAKISKYISVNLDKTLHTENKVHFNPKFLYVQALNLKNAKKKFVKIIIKANENKTK
jgi:hypothetical protein